MSDQVSDTHRENKEYYSSLYRRRSTVLSFLLSKLSYDQLSKTKRNVRLISRHLVHRPGQRLSVLDFGCGRGTFLRSLPWRPLTLYGVDLVPEALSTLSRYPWGRRRQFVPWPQPLEIAVPKERMDIACASHVLEHVVNAELALDALVRALKPGGMLLINVPINEVFDDPRHVRKYSGDLNQLSHRQLEVVDHEKGDRWSSFLMTHQYGPKRPRRSMLIALRTLRAVLALLPLAINEKLEMIFLPARYRDSQLLVLAKKLDG